MYMLSTISCPKSISPAHQCARGGVPSANQLNQSPRGKIPQAGRRLSVETTNARRRRTNRTRPYGRLVSDNSVTSDKRSF